MIKIVNELLAAANSGKPTVLRSLDISAASDTLNHDRLLNRATDLFGLSGRIVLTDRTGPTIFTSPVSRLISVFIVTCHQYADDTQM